MQTAEGSRILLTLDMTNALRPSELFAFRWKCHRTTTVPLTIVETIYTGRIRPFGKTKGSLIPFITNCAAPARGEGHE